MPKQKTRNRLQRHANSYSQNAIFQHYRQKKPQRRTCANMTSAQSTTRQRKTIRQNNVIYAQKNNTTQAFLQSRREQLQRTNTKSSYSRSGRITRQRPTNYRTLQQATATPETRQNVQHQSNYTTKCNRLDQKQTKGSKRTRTLMHTNRQLRSNNKQNYRQNTKIMFRRRTSGRLHMERSRHDTNSYSTKPTEQPNKIKQGIPLYQH